MTSYVRGFDCAWPQGKVDWDKVPDEYRYVFVQVANGVHGRDPTGPPNLAGVRRTKRYACVYLFFNTDQDPVAQVENMFAACGDTMPDAIWIDFETLAKNVSPAGAADRLGASIDACRAWGAMPVDVYTYPNFAIQVIGPKVLEVRAIHKKANLSIADYSKGESVDGKTPWIVKPWDDWKWWQTSGNNSGLIPGVNGHVDHGVFNGDEAALRAYLGLGEPVPDTLPETVHPAIEFPQRDPPTEE